MHEFDIMREAVHAAVDHGTHKTKGIVYRNEPSLRCLQYVAGEVGELCLAAGQEHGAYGEPRDKTRGELADVFIGLFDYMYKEGITPQELRREVVGKLLLRVDMPLVFSQMLESWK